MGSSRTRPLGIDGETLALEDVADVAAGFTDINLTPQAVERIRASRQVISQLLRSGEVAYGVNTGFGRFADVRIPDSDIEKLQENLVVSHAAGVGPALPEEVTRAVLVLKLNTLAKGYSGCRLETAQTLLEMLRRGVHPVIPEQGSVGASGDLAPLAHMTLPMVGLGEAVYRGQRLPGRQAMEAAEIPLLRLQAKEGLALLNGTQFMTAIGSLSLLQAENLCRHADLIGTMSAEGLLATPVAWDARIQLARGLPGQIRVAENLRKLIEGSEIRQSHVTCSRVQDAYSVRCMPQVHGAIRDAVGYVRSVLEAEINAATDNPLVFAEEGEVLSGGNFHGHPVAIAMDLLAQVMAQLANISERRIEYLCDPDMSDMAGFLTEHGGLNSGFMIAQVTAASLVSENKVLAHPASVDSIPTSANKEDYVSMGSVAARQARDIVENTETVLAIELLCACQGLDLRSPLQPAPATKAALEAVRAQVPHLDRDRLLHLDIAAAKRLIRTGELLQAVQPLVGQL